MGNKSVVFIAFQEHENLGIGYMHALLSGAGYKVFVIDFNKDKADILKELKELDSLVVGFSVIFQYHLYEFQELIEYLRKEGVQSHFTAGGHFASLRPGDLFGIIPGLDSIVRFEGEYTLLDLADHLWRGADWTSLHSVSFMKDGAVVNNQLRPLEPVLDNFPVPFRPDLDDFALDKKFATIIAGRGCIYNCAFCDIHKFYGQPPGYVKRIRNPVSVMEEMEFLFKEHGCSIFLFQDDDFPVKVNRKTDWVEEFCMELREKDLVGQTMWKINCRPDEVDRMTFELMRQHGLFKVYLGIEDGTDAGLLRMNKHLKASDNLRGIQVLKELGIGIDYGFMLFQPSTTYNTLNENLDFLDQICGDGYMSVYFLKMKPYLETRIEEELRDEGRLKGRPGFLDYDFLDDSMNDFYTFVSEHFNKWFHNAKGINNISKWAFNYLAVFKYSHGSLGEIDRITDHLKIHLADANRFVIDTMRELSALFESGKYTMEDDVLKEYETSIKEKHQEIAEELAQMVRKIEIISLTKEVIDWN
jgi:anaerobic magnesium-protoporphyrin IX monomethyl ester cyclase